MGDGREQPVPTRQGVDESPVSLWAAEYGALREETITRIRTQDQLILVALVAPGTVLGVGLKLDDPAIILLYPLFALMLTAAWAHQDYRKRQIGVYIKDYIEKYAGFKLPSSGTVRNIGWEHYLVARRDYPSLLYLSSRGIFVGTEILALIVGLAESNLFAWVSPTLIALVTQTTPKVDFGVLSDPHRGLPLLVTNLWQILVAALAIVSTILTLAVLRRVSNDLKAARVADRDEAILPPTGSASPSLIQGADTMKITSIPIIQDSVDMRLK